MGSIFSGHLLIPTSGLFLDLDEQCELWQDLGACFRLMVGGVYFNLLVKDF